MKNVAKNRQPANVYLELELAVVPVLVVPLPEPLVTGELVDVVELQIREVLFRAAAINLHGLSIDQQGKESGEEKIDRNQFHRSREFSLAAGQRRNCISTVNIVTKSFLGWL